MAWIKIIEEDNADDSVAELYAKMQDPRTGRVDNIMKVHSLHPRGMAGHFFPIHGRDAWYRDSAAGG